MASHSYINIWCHMKKLKLIFQYFEEGRTRLLYRFLKKIHNEDLRLLINFYFDYQIPLKNQNYTEVDINYVNFKFDDEDFYGIKNYNYVHKHVNPKELNEFYITYSINFFILSALTGNYDIIFLLLTQYHLSTEYPYFDDNNYIDLKCATNAFSLSPLWCAVYSGNLNLVKLLVKHGANINTMNLYIKYSQNKKLLINPNISPLMLACIKGHKQIVQYLLLKKASLYSTNDFGYNSIHYLCRYGHLDIIKILLCTNIDSCDQKNLFNNKELYFNTLLLVEIVNPYPLSPLKLAVENNKIMCATYLLSLCLKYFEKEHFNIINVKEVYLHEICAILELLAIYYIHEPTQRDYSKTKYYLRLANRKKLEFNLSKTVNTLADTCPNSNHPIFAHHWTQIGSPELLQSCIHSVEYLYYKTLHVSEKIQGLRHPGFSLKLKNFGTVLAKRKAFHKCITLWIYALEVDLMNGMSINETLIKLLRIYSQMTKMGMRVNFDHFIAVIMYAHRSLTMDLQRQVNSKENMVFSGNQNLNEESSASIMISIKENIEVTMKIVLYTCQFFFIYEILCNVKESNTFKRKIYEITRLDPRGTKGSSLLHMAVDYSTKADEFLARDGNCSFPNHKIVELLLACGHDIDAFDDFGNTPLLVAASHPYRHIRSFPIPVLVTLISEGAHKDYVNSSGHSLLRDLVPFTLKNTPLVSEHTKPLNKFIVAELDHLCPDKSESNSRYRSSYSSSEAIHIDYCFPLFSEADDFLFTSVASRVTSSADEEFYSDLTISGLSSSSDDETFDIVNDTRYTHSSEDPSGSDDSAQNASFQLRTLPRAASRIEGEVYANATTNFHLNTPISSPDDTSIITLINNDGERGHPLDNNNESDAEEDLLEYYREAIMNGRLPSEQFLFQEDNERDSNPEKGGISPYLSFFNHTEVSLQCLAARVIRKTPQFASSSYRHVLCQNLINFVDRHGPS